MPVLLGIPAILGWLASAIGALGSAVVAWFTHRSAVVTLWIAATLALLAGFVAFIDAQIANALTYLSGFDWGPVVTNVMPDSAGVVAGIALSVDVAKWSYDKSQELVNRKFS